MSNKTNEVRNALRQIIDKEGASCLRDAGRFRSLWMDYVPQSKEAKLILSAIQEGVGSTLLAAKDKDEAGQRQSINRCEQQMVEAFITEEGSRYAVREIASALNIDVDRIMPVPAETGTVDLQPRRGPGSVSRQVQEPVSSPERQEIYPGQERYPRQQDRQKEEFPAGSAFKETPAKKKSRFPWLLLLLLLIIVGAGAGMFLTRGNDTTPAIVPPVDVQDEEKDVLGVVPPVILPEDEEEPAEDDSLNAAVQPIVTPEPAEESMAYEIDTITTNVGYVSSMVMDNGNNLYYIVGKEVHCTQTDTVVDFTTDSSDVAFLAHDPYSDTVYLFTNVDNTDPTITDITNYWDGEIGVEIEPVLNKESCPRLAEFTFYMPDTSNHTTQIGILKNGSLLVPVKVSGFWNEGDSDTYMINIEQKTATPVLPRYMYRTNPILVAEDQIVEVVRNVELSRPYANIISFSGETTSVEIERKPPITPMYSRDGIIYFYDNDYGVCGLNLDGTIATLIPKESVKVLDYQSLAANIGAFSAGTEEHFAFYDTALECIRMIQPTGSGTE